MKSLIKILKTFYGFEARNKVLFGGFMAVTLFSYTLSAIIPYFFKVITERLMISDYSTLHYVIWGLIVLKFAILVSQNISFYLGDKIGFAGAIAARKEIFKHVQDLDFAFHAEKSTGSLISAFKRGDGALWSLFHIIHFRFLDIAVAFIVMMAFFLKINLLIMLVVLFSLIFSLLITNFLVRLNIDKRRQHNDEEDNISGIVVDNMVNFETVKLFSKENFELKRLEKAFVPWLSTGWGYVTTFRYIDLSIGTLINLSILSILLLSLNLAKGGSLGIPDFVLVLGFVTTFYPKLFEMVYGFREIGKNYTDVEKYFGLLDYDIEIKDPARPEILESVKGEIEFKNVSFSYKEGKKNALNGVNLKVRQGQSIALVGRSGSGKTTLVKLLMRFYDVSKGEVVLDGININKLGKSHLRSHMGVVPQEPVLFNNTIGYNIGYGKENVSQEEIEAAAKIANIHTFIASLSKGYETHVGERGIKLSGGQKQRIAIARMVLSDPEIIIFDEATSQLDSENEKLIQEAFWRVAKNKTTIIIAHRLSTAMSADKIVVMEKGKIVEVGSHEELTSKPSLYKYFWDLQTRVV